MTEENAYLTKLRIKGVLSELEALVQDVNRTLNGAERSVQRLKDMLDTPYGEGIDGMNTPLPISIKCYSKDVKYTPFFTDLNGITESDLKDIKFYLQMGYRDAHDGTFLEISASDGFLEAHKASLLKSGIVTGYSADTPPDSICRFELESRLTLNALVCYKKHIRQNRRGTGTKGLQ